MGQIMVLAAQVAQQATQYKFAITLDKFLESLPIMGKGMLGIFIVMGIIIAVISILNDLKLPEGKKKDSDK